MQQSLNLHQIQQSLSHFLHRYHVLVFVFTVIGGLSLATFMINQAINTPSTQSTTAETTGNFDKATMEKIKALRKTDEAPKQLVLPTGRANPFQ